jgi:hypothetical protein
MVDDGGISANIMNVSFRIATSGVEQRLVPVAKGCADRTQAPLV